MKKYLFLILMLAATLVYGQNTCDTLGVNVLKGVQYNTVPATSTRVIKILDTLEFPNGTKQWSAPVSSGNDTTYPDSSVLFTDGNGKAATDSSRFIYTGGRYMLSSSTGAMNSKNMTLPLGFSFLSSGTQGMITKYYYASSASAKNTFRFVRFRGSNTSPASCLQNDETGQFEFYAGDTSGLLNYRYTIGNTVIGTSTNDYFNSAFVFTKGYSNLSSSIKLGSLPSAMNIYGNGKLTVNPVDLADSLFTFKTNGNAAITQTSVSVSLLDSTIVKDHLTGELKVVSRTENITTIFGGVTATESDNTILANATSGLLLLTLPTSVPAGKTYSIKKIDASGNAVVVNTLGGAIDGAVSYNLNNQYDYLTVQWDGVNYWILAK